MTPVINAHQRQVLNSLEDRRASDPEIREIIEAAMQVRNADANRLIRGHGYADPRITDKGREALERLAKSIDGFKT